MGYGSGAFLKAAAEIVKDPSTREPNAALTSAITKHANANGLLLISAGINSNVVRFLAPLTITDEELTKGLSILTATLAEVSKQ